MKKELPSFQKVLISYPHAKLPSQRPLGILKWTFFSLPTDSETSFLWFKSVIRAWHTGFLVRSSVLLSSSNHRMSFWAQDVTGWQVSPTRAGRIRGPGDAPVEGTCTLTAGAAAMGRVGEALQDGLLNWGFDFISTQDQEKVLVQIRGFLLAYTGMFLGLVRRMVELGDRPEGRKPGCVKLQRCWGRCFWARKEMSYVGGEELEWKTEQAGKEELLTWAARWGTTSMWEHCLLFGFHTLA